MDIDFNRIITVMKQTYDRDISMYNRSFLLKSLERRWNETGVNKHVDYCSFLEESNTEAEAFYSSLHITYSQFFREALTFALLEQMILPSLSSQKPDERELRIWSAGCSNGQEAYSLAMLLAELAERSGKELSFRIFATDIAQEALAAGRAGVYDQNAVQNVKLKHLHKYFTKQDETYTIVPQLRRRISFYSYDLLELSTAYPPESIYGDFDLVMCSNLLFYYRNDLQQLIIKKIQQALSPMGYLVTGEAEKSFVENATKLQTLALPSAIFKNSIRRGVI